MDPIEIQWGIFFVLSLFSVTTTVMADPIEAWGIFFLSGLAVQSASAGTTNGVWFRRHGTKSLIQNSRLEVNFLHMDSDLCREQEDCQLELIASVVSGKRSQHDYGSRISATLDTSSFDIRKTFTKDICGQMSKVQSANIQATAQFDELNNVNLPVTVNFDCPVRLDSVPADNESAAEWSNEFFCGGIDQKDTR